MARLRISQVCRFCVTDGVPQRSLLFALVVGTILNLINQGDVLFGGGDLNIAKIILSFAVPYCSATYGAVSYQLRAANSGRWP
jgi:hypothetical protein